MAIIQVIEFELGRCQVRRTQEKEHENWIMATATFPNTTQYVQQAFNWDEIDANPVIAKTPTQLAAVMIPAQPLRSSPVISVSTYTTSTSTRRGRCEHVGGILASVLQRYGIGIDQLIAEIDG